MSADSSGPFAGTIFTTPDGRLRWFTEAVLRHTGAAGEMRILDLGCGTGREAVSLAEVMVRSRVTGVDISENNIREAEALRRASPAGARITFVTADYLEFKSEPFDLVVSDSTLQNIPGLDSELFSKLAADIVPGGILVVTWPYDCLYNRCLWLIRRALRGVRSRGIDAAILALGRLLHRSLDEALIVQRIEYMYLLPFRRDGAALRTRLKDEHGFDLVEEEPVPHVSIAQPKHRLCVFRRRA